MGKKRKQTPEEREAWKREVEMAGFTLDQFGNRIKALCAERGISVRKLAFELSIEPVLLHRIVRGDSVPRERNLTVLLDWAYHPSSTEED